MFLMSVVAIILIMLEAKIAKAAQAIVKNNSLLICSGSGMLADCQLYENNRLL
jgi:hypothetical protein